MGYLRKGINGLFKIAWAWRGRLASKEGQIIPWIKIHIALCILV